MRRRLDRIRGCLLGAAAGDALGYCVNELTAAELENQYGPEGIQGYDSLNGMALVSAHTQMMLYTANGLLFGATRGALRGVMAPYVRYLDVFYREWATTQRYGPMGPVGRHLAWLTTRREMHSRRNPDRFTLLMLEKEHLGTMAEPISRSQNPLCLTRTIPIGLFMDPHDYRPSETRLLGAECAALTAGEPLGFLSAAYLTELLCRIIYGKESSFRNILHEAHKVMQEQFGKQFRQLETLRALLQAAEDLADSSVSTREAMERMNAQDASSVLACAAYVCLKYPGDYDRGIVAAVNHSGLSAAVGTVVGALLGAMIGTEGIPEFYLEPLELRDILEEIGNDIFRGCPMSQDSRLYDDEWDTKYVQCTY